MDLALLCVKTYQNEIAVPLMRPLVGPDTTVLCLQNGVDSYLAAAEVLGDSLHNRMSHPADYWQDHQVTDDVPLHPGDDLYALSKYLGGHITRVFAEERGLDVITYLFCGFRTRQIQPRERGGGVSSFTVSWEDSGRSFLHGLRAGDMPTPYEVFFIAAETPDRKYRVDKARRLLGWEAEDTFEELYRRPTK